MLHQIKAQQFNTAYAAPNKGTTILYLFANTVILVSPLSQSSISEVEF